MRRIILGLILTLSPVSVASQGLEDWYAIMSEWAGVDPNAGLTTFLTLVMPTGGIYQSMGTAYTAVAKDSGYLEANPAGSALLQDTELSILHNDWIYNSSLESMIYTIRYRDFGIGFGAKYLHLPLTSIDSWGEREVNNGKVAKGEYREVVGTANLSLNLFSNYYFSGLTLGGNVKMAYRGVPDVIYSNQSALSLMVDLGVMTKFNFLKFYPSRTKNLSFGATLRNLGLPVQGDPLPSALVLGMAYNPIRPLTLAVDGTLPIVLSKDFSLGNFGTFSVGGSTAEKPHVSVGMDLVVTSFFSLQGGIQFKTGRPRISAGTSIAWESVTFNINYSLDLTTKAEIFDRFSLEAKFNLGDLGRRDTEERARSLYLQGLEFYAKGSLTEAIEALEQSLILNPQFNPAQEQLKIAKDVQELQKTLRELQQIETPTP